MPCKDESPVSEARVKLLWRELNSWVLVLVATVGAAGLLNLLGAPTPYLLGGALAGAAVALTRRQPLVFPDSGRQLGLAVIGVAAGSMLDARVVDTIVERPAVVFGGVAATLLLSLATGQLLRLSPHVNLSTAVFSSIAGGASAVSAVAREMGADEAIVLAIQYLRVLLVLVTVPLVVSLIGSSGSDAPAAQVSGWSGGWFTLAALSFGVGLATVLRFSAAGLVVPLLVSSGLSVSGVFASTAVPAAVLAVGYGATGLMVGLSFNRLTVRQLVRVLPLASLQAVLTIVGCAVIGLLFAQAADVSRMDGYLATTPGGLPAVIAIAIGSGASIGIVITMQIARVVLVLLLTPVLGAVLRWRDEADPA